MESILETLEPRQARDVLSGLIEHLTPQPHELSSLDPIEERLLQEFRERLNLKRDDNSDAAVAKLLPVITREFTARLLDKQAESRAQRRLGARGVLPLNKYDIEFGPNFIKSQYRGLHKSHASDAIRRPDKVEHFGPDPNSEFPKFSIFAKYIDRRNDPAVVLFLCSREESKLIVQASNRLFLSDIESFNPLDTPLGWLRAFARKYGVSFFLNGAGPFGFINDQVFPGSGVEIAFHKDSEFRGDPCILAKPSRLGVVHVALAYVIDSDKYLHDLRRHGLPVRTPSKR
jgi:hypothetical protein